MVLGRIFQGFTFIQHFASGACTVFFNICIRLNIYIYYVYLFIYLFIYKACVFSCIYRAAVVWLLARLTTTEPRTQDKSSFGLFYSRKSAILLTLGLLRYLSVKDRVSSVLGLAISTSFPPHLPQRLLLNLSKSKLVYKLNFNIIT